MRRVEARLAVVAAGVLERPAVGVDQDLFALGADSLRAAELLARVQDEFGVEVSLDQLFAAPTVAGLAALVAGAAASGAAVSGGAASGAAAAWPGGEATASAPLVRVAAAERAGPLPLSFAQRRLWFLHQLEPGNPVHNLAAAVRLEGDLAVPVLAAVLGEIVRRHEALRTAFTVAGGEPAQVVRPPFVPALPVVDLGGLPPARRQAAARGAARRLARGAFDLERGQVLRLALLRLRQRREHELIVVLHHIAADGGSFAVLAGELSTLYAAYALGRRSPLAELPVQAADHAVWLRRRAAPAALAGGLAWWRERLAGELSALELPADRARPAVASHRGAHHEHRFGAAVGERVEALARQARATPFMVLLTAFAALLARSTGRRDLLLGAPAAGRDRVELAGLIGVFLNNLVLRVDAGGEPGFGLLLARVREAVVGALAHQEVPFERLVDELQPGRDLSRSPLFQVMFVGQNAPLVPRVVPGLRLAPREIDLGTARFDLAVSVAPLGAAAAGWLGTWKWATDLFDGATVVRWASHFESLLAAGLEDAAMPIGRLAMLSPGERHQVAAEWNDTVTRYAGAAPPGRCLHELIAAQAARTPAAVAVEAGAVRLTYGELLAAAGRLAARLAAAGVGAEARVGILAERSLELVVGLLGTLLAGAAYVPFDPDYPAERLAYMLEDSGVEALVAQAPLVARLGPLPARLAGGGGRVVELAPGAGLAAGGGDAGSAGVGGGGAAGAGATPAAAAAASVWPESPAYAIYTSGSTGRPKGAVVSHRAIVNRLLWMQAAYGLGADDRVLQKTPASFDVSVWEFFWPLLAGARLVMAPPQAHQDPARLLALVREHAVTTLHFVPSMLQVFVDQPGLAAGCGSVARIFASGEALPRDLAERCLERLPGAALHNLYGPTEAAVDVTFHPCRRGDRRPVPIGRPIANTAVVLLDGGGEVVPVGVPGELHIGGVALARGYLGRPELTAERFVPDPRPQPAGAGGGRLYRTGDLARLRADGEVEYLGRLDHQVKVRGVRIELGEIEAALTRHAAVREAVVVARRDPRQGEVRLAAYLVAAAGAAAPPVEELRAHLRGSLPEAMVPASFTVLAALPLTPSGKVDRKALPEPAAAGGAGAGVGAAGGGAARRPPRSAVERRLAALWSEQLGVAHPGIDDSFFELGGDSIQGAILVNRLQRELDAVVYVMALFDHPTVAGLAAHLEASYGPALAAAGWVDGEAAASGGGEGAGAAGGVGAAAGDGAEDAAADAADMAALVAHLAGRFSPAPAEPAAARAAGTDAERRQLPRAVFLLSPFRSGSTLLRVMLAGHPGLFAPPELELLGFDSLGERRRVFDGRDSFAREGLLRAVMELHGCDADGAAALLAAAEERDEATPLFYRRLQEWAGGRLLVDKTPRYSLDGATLRRAERWFAAPLYVHLVRHPAATMKSYLEARMDEVYRFPLPPRRQAELVWRRSHETILDFLAGVPAERQMRLGFEALVGEPRTAIAALCGFLGLDFADAMLTPYEGRRMTDGLHGAGRMMGDPKFHTHQKIEAAVADRWRDEAAWSRLGAATWRLAARLGYAAPVAVAGQASPVPASAGKPGPVVAPARPLPAIRPVARGGEIPLAFAQERLWFIDQLERGKGLYAMPGALRLRGAVRREVLAACLAEIARRHEAVRTRFVAVGGRPTQVIAGEWRPPLPFVDLAALPRAGAEAALGALAAAEQGPVFDLARGPLLRASLARVADGDFVLFVTMHHIVSDGWSIGLLLRELTALYPAFDRGQASPLPELAVQYADFAMWQRQWLSGEVLAEQLDFWQRELAGLPPLVLPGDRPAGAAQVYRAGAHPVAVPAALAARLDELARGLGASLFMVLLALFEVLLHHLSGQDDLAVGTPIAGRNRAEIEPLIGFFVNTLVLRSRLALRPGGDGPSLREHAAAVRRTTLGAYDHQELPFALLVEALRPDRRQGALPLVDVLFTLQNQPMPDLALPGIALELLSRLDAAELRTQFALVLNLRRVPEGLAGTLTYNAALFDAATAERFRDEWLSLVEQALAEPERPLGGLPLLAAGARRQVVAAASPVAAAAGEADSVPAPGAAAPAESEAAAAETLRQARTNLSNRRDNLSAMKRELLAKRLRGEAAPASGERAAGGGAAPAPAVARPGAILQQAALDLAAEVVLDPAIVPRAAGGVRSLPAAGVAGAAGAEGAAGAIGAAGAGGAVLVTGATGFLGAYLVAELLAQTAARVVCLVRGATVAEAGERLRATLAGYGLWSAAAAARVAALPADLSRPLLGLAPADFDALAGEVAAIYHNGAWVNASYPYPALKAANVQGTEEVLRLACRAGAVPVHFVSTLSVFFAPEYGARRDKILEDDPLAFGEGGGSGYAQSKWVAEKLVAVARGRGLPASIYRFGRATWHSTSGVWNKNDALRHILAASLQLGSAPDVDVALDLIPVDFVAAAIVGLSRGAAGDRSYHLISEQDVTWRDLVGWLRELGHPLALMPLGEWLQAAKLGASQEALPHVLKLRGVAAKDGGAGAEGGGGAAPVGFAARFGRANALAGLAGSGIVCPPIDAPSLGAFLQHLQAARRGER